MTKRKQKSEAHFPEPEFFLPEMKGILEMPDLSSILPAPSIETLFPNQKTLDKMFKGLDEGLAKLFPANPNSAVTPGKSLGPK